VFLIGILLGSIFISRQVFSQSDFLQDEDKAGIEESIKEVKIFPNPSNGRFTLTFEYSGQAKINARVFDITGKQVKDISDDLIRSEKSLKASVDLESPSSGIYFVRIEWGKSMHTKKIIIR
jgi:type IX secretion system substrate protein